MSLSATVRSLQQIMRKDVGVDGDAQRLGQLVWMLFLKIWDDREAELELLDPSYRSPLPESLRWRSWAADDEGLTGDALMDFVNGQLFPTLKNLELGPQRGGEGAEDRRQEAVRLRRVLIRSVFEDAYNYMKSGTLLRQVINKINESIDFNDSQNRHLFGDIYETLLKDLQGAGNAGEYYTPRALTQFAVNRVNPRLGEVVLDPACGTGGFLTAAIEHVRRNDVRSPEHEAQLQRLIRGVEKKPLPHLLCVTNMIVHGVDVPTTIMHDNTLSRPLRDYGPKDRVDVIVTNPPFGGMEEDGVESNFPTAFQTRETADLFLLLIIALLRPGGRAAVVLPDGTLFGEGVKSRIKEKLLAECDLHTVVRLPKGVFAPYTSIQTNILFFTKGKPTSEIWYYEHPYPPGYKSYSKTKPMDFVEFAPETEWWDRREENDRAWKVSVEAVRAAGFNLDMRNPRGGSASLPPPDVVLRRFEDAVARASELRSRLRHELSRALGVAQ